MNAEEFLKLLSHSGVENRLQDIFESRLKNLFETTLALSVKELDKIDESAWVSDNLIIGYFW